MLDTRFDDLYLIIPHITAPRILCINDGYSWSLPKITIPLVPSDHRWRDVTRINHAVLEHLGINVITLEAVYVSPYPAPEEHGSAVFVVELRSLNWGVPDGGQWIDREALADLHLALPEHQPALDTWFDSRQADARLTLPWTQAGWFDAAATWMHTQCQAHELVATGEVEQVRSWFLSCVLRMSTAMGDQYLKAAPPMYAHEPRLTHVLAARYPTLVPQVLAVDAERRWLLMEGIRGVRLDQYPDSARYTSAWMQLLQSFAYMQRDFTAHVDQLLALGCPDWRLDRLATAIDPFFLSLPSILRDGDTALSSAEWQELRAVAPRLKAMCLELDQIGIPPSLHHGDFHSGNILANDTVCKLIDWAGFVGVTHPFLSLWVVFEEHENGHTWERLRDQYLEIWQAYAPPNQLRAAIKLALPIAAWCGALGHRTQLEQAITRIPWDVQGEQDSMLSCLRRMVALLQNDITSS